MWVYSAQDVREYVYDFGGREAGEIKAGVLQRRQLYLGGMHLAVLARQTDGSDNMFYLHSDWLGTVRKASSNTLLSYAINSADCAVVVVHTRGTP
ncbi:MAG TPA: hypothetical protein VEB03_00090 [Candidatus Nanoarchaeia archaeon]|nr:hypothetical protein [Candidatus Nanoarchaeia archaeon]